MSFSIPPSSSRTMNRGLSPRMRNSSPHDFYDQNITFDFAALPLTSHRFELDTTEENFLIIQEKIMLCKSNLNSCPKCFEYLNLVQDLEEICKSYSKHRSRLLNSFFEIYLNLQEESKKSRDLHSKYQKLQQEIDDNLGGLTDRKVNNKIKSLKNEIKHKSNQVIELTEKLKAIESVNGFNKKLEAGENLSREINEKDKLIMTMQQIIKEKMPGTVIPAGVSCRDCLKKSAEIENLNFELNRTREATSSNKKEKIIKDVKNPLVKTMVEIQDRIRTWWENKQDFPSQAWKREGEELVLSLESRVAIMAESTVEQPGRDLRSAVHKKIIEVEADFLDIETHFKNFTDAYMNDSNVMVVVEKVKQITEKFLELPYLLKPLFDLLKDYEKKELIT